MHECSTFDTNHRHALVFSLRIYIFFVIMFIFDIVLYNPKAQHN